MQELNLHGSNFEDIINTKGTFSKSIVKPGKIKKLFPRETTIHCFKLTTFRGLSLSRKCIESELDYHALHGY
jgi:hypothetical protein